MRIAVEKKTEEATHDDGTVRVKCLGIACLTGFQLEPVGYPPSYVSFMPGEYMIMAKHYADYLVAQDRTRFVVEKK